MHPLLIERFGDGLPTDELAAQPRRLREPRNKWRDTPKAIAARRRELVLALNDIDGLNSGLREYA